MDRNGFQLDFASHVPCLPVGRQWELRHHVTEFVRMVREMTLEVAGQRGRPFLLAARVPRSLKGCRIDGLDVDASPPVGSPLAYDPTKGVETPRTTAYSGGKCGYNWRHQPKSAIRAMDAGIPNPLKLKPKESQILPRCFSPGENELDSKEI